VIDCPSRIGQLYLLDHGGGNLTLRLVVGRQERDLLEGEPCWQQACVRLSDGHTWTRADSDREFRYLDSISRVPGSNVVRVL